MIVVRTDIQALPIGTPSDQVVILPLIASLFWFLYYLPIFLRINLLMDIQKRAWDPPNSFFPPFISPYEQYQVLHQIHG